MQSDVLPISCTTHATNQLYYLYYQSAVLVLPMSHTIHTTQLHAHTTNQHTPCPTNQLCYLYYQSAIQYYVQICHLHQTPAVLPITCYYQSSGWVYLYLNQRWKEFVPERGTARMEETWSVRPSTGIAAECTGDCIHHRHCARGKLEYRHKTQTEGQQQNVQVTAPTPLCQRGGCC